MQRVNEFALVVLVLTLSATSACVARAPVFDPPQSAEPFRIDANSIPRAKIAGSVLRAPRKARGTIFMCHGFHRSSWDFRDYDWLAEREGWNVVRFDFRQHGASSKDPLRAPTLGYYEIWDMKAVIDWAESQNLEKPYVCYGHSMGAAIALRWAGRDPRISGVLAQSSFVNGLDAINKYRPDDKRVQFAKMALVHNGLRGMLKEVDIPTAVSSRDDLLLWLTAGEHDYFPESDQRAILNASHSPGSMKKLVIIQGAGHSDQWRWPGNDALIQDFLATAASSNAPSAHHARAAGVISTGTVAATVAVELWRRIEAKPTRYQTLRDSARRLARRASHWYR